MDGISDWLTRTTPRAAGIFSFGFLDPQRVAWRKRGAEVAGWAERGALRFDQEPIPAQAVSGSPALRPSDAVPVREAWHRATGTRDGLSFVVFDLRSKCKAVAGGPRAPIDRVETLAVIPLPAATIPELSLWVFSTARPGTPEAAAVTMARRWAGGVAGRSGGVAQDLVIDSCVATWKPEQEGQLGDVVLDSHPGLFLSGSNPDALRRLFGERVAAFFDDKRGWRVESSSGALLLSCDVERMPAGWNASLPGLVAADHLDEFVSRAVAIATLLRDESAATAP